jgi:hypothetical protein
MKPAITMRLIRVEKPALAIQGNQWIRATLLTALYPSSIDGE